MLEIRQDLNGQWPTDRKTGLRTPFAFERIFVI